MTSPLPTALDYATKGWRIVPIRPGEKRPALTNWQNIATADPELITEWFTGPYHDHGIGIATGPETGFFVLDVDITDTKAGDETLADLEEQYGRLPETLMSITGSGGWHLLFTYPTGQEIRNDAGRRLGPGLDIRGIGGQIVAPPTIHPNGNAYQWDHGCQTIADAPQWLLELLTTPEPTQPPPSPAKPSDTDSIAARYNQQTTWSQLLQQDGWTLAASLPTGETQWTRPGKDIREGISATCGHEGRDILTTFTSSIPWLPEDSYSRFGYYACRHHNGNRSAAATHLLTQETQTLDNYFTNQLITPEPTPELTTETRIELAHLVDWTKLWTDDRPDEEWLAEPIIPKGRAIALYAPAKAGKSTITLAIVAAVATGSRILGQTRATPTNVLYLDYEMTEDDLIERLTELGYGPQDNLEKLHYALLPSLPPLDTIEGATALLHLVDQTKAELVVVDTFGRAVEGDEDRADTVRAFYLKARGVAVLRTDHSGKSVEKGMRGSSAKADDVDIVWQLSRTNTNKGDGVRLNRTHSRLSWVPQDIRISRIETDHGHDYVIDAQDQAWPDGTRQDADLLQSLNLPDNPGFNTTKTAVREAGHKMRDSRIRTALKFRKQAANSQEHMRLTAGITNNSQAHKRVGRAANDRDALDGTRQRDAQGEKWDAPDALTKPHVTDSENRDAVDPERDAVAASQTGRERVYEGTRSLPATPDTQTQPLF
jgi:hypothetical protein